MSLGLLQLGVVGTISGLANNQAANVAYGALATLLSGGTAPTAGNTGLSSVAGVPWRDTGVTPNVIRLRDDADTAFIPLMAVDQTGKVAAPYLAGTRSVTGTTDTVVASDIGKLVTYTNAANIAVTLPQATTAGFGKGFWFAPVCLRSSAGKVTITPTTSTIDGAASIVLYAGQACLVVSDGANYFTVAFANAPSMRLDGPIGIGAAPISQSQLLVGTASLSVVGADTNFAAGGNRAMIDLSGGIARIGGINGGGSNVDCHIYARNGAVFKVGAGAQIGSPTGGDPGSGYLNVAGGIQVNGVAVGSGKLVKRYAASYATNTALTVAIPVDDTIPQNTEGTQILSINVDALQSASNIIRVSCWGIATRESGASDHQAMALFSSAQADALQVGHTYNTNTEARMLGFVYEFAPGVTTARTYSIRVGAGSGNMRMNGIGSSRYYGGAASVVVVIEELQP